MAKFIVTPVGISILINGLREKVKEINSFANFQENDTSPEFIKFKKEFEPQFLAFKQELYKLSDNELKILSAELHALLKFYEKERSQNNFHQLIITDTYLGRKSADLIKQIIETKNLGIVNSYSPKGLKTNDVQEFQTALSDLVKELSSQLELYKQQNYEIIFNLTGGFKSINSFLQTMASLWADRSIYIFEKTEELLIIPKLPIKVDEQIFRENINLFRKLELELPVNINEINYLPKTLYYDIAGEYTLTEWGELVWQKIKQELYKENLLAPLTEKIDYSSEFKKDFEKLSKEEKRQLNEKIDKLILYVKKGINPKSLRYHSLTGEISKKYSHEFYPFSGDDSRRVYCNEKNNKIILKKIGAHLK